MIYKYIKKKFQNCLHYIHFNMSSVLLKDSVGTTTNSRVVCSVSDNKMYEDQLGILRMGCITPTKHGVHEVVCPGAPKKPKQPQAVCSVSDNKMYEDQLEILRMGCSTPTKHGVHEVVCPGAPRKPKQPSRVAGLRR